MSFVPRDLDLQLFDPKIHGFPGLMMEHFCVTFGDRSWISFWDFVWKKTDRQTNKQTPVKTPTPRLPLAWVIISDNLLSSLNWVQCAVLSYVVGIAICLRGWNKLRQIIYLDKNNFFQRKSWLYEELDAWFIVTEVDELNRHISYA